MQTPKTNKQRQVVPPKIEQIWERLELIQLNLEKHCRKFNHTSRKLIRAIEKLPPDVQRQAIEEFFYQSFEISPKPVGVDAWLIKQFFSLSGNDPTPSVISFAKAKGK
ncbi:MAG: hypothetical protein ACO1QB_04870 [Verrucomicrobiales bacterium]